MKIAIVAKDWEEIEKRLAAMPYAMQSEVYGKGFLASARAAARKARVKCPVGKGPALTSKGKPRRRLSQSIRAVPVGWHWNGVKIKKSAAIVVAEQPHAHLVEAIDPFLEPAMRDGLAVNHHFKIGAGRAFGRTIRQLEQGKFTGSIRRVLR